MKKFTFLCTILCVMCTAFAQRPTSFWSKAPFKVETQSTVAVAATTVQAEATVVLEEDFSLFTAGSEEIPDDVNIAPEVDYTYLVDTAYTHQPGWLGYYVFQAGGCAALKEYEYYGYMYGGYISTPEAELYGEATITFRARRAGNSPAAGDLDLSLCDNTMGRLESKEFKLTTEWQEFSFTSNQGTFNNRNIFQFCTMGGTILIDDIKVTRVRNRVPDVYALQPINNSSTEFVARWERSTLPTIDGYLFSVWYKEMPDKEESGKISCDFESINIKADGKSIETEFPNYPRGWDIDVSSHGEKDMCTTKGDYQSGQQAINFDAEGDYILSPEAKAPIHKISFWVKPSSMASEEYDFSLVGVHVRNTMGHWEHIANIPNYWMQENGGIYTLEGDVVGNYITQVKLTCEGSFGITFAIDDITLEYRTQPMPKALFTDSLVVDTFCVVSNYDPTKEHYYNVKVKEGDLISDQSDDIWVDGINGITPVALPATDITENSFTANWEPNYNADTYKVSFTQTVVTTYDNQEVTMLEEDFSGIVDGTFSNPGFSWDLVHNLGENGQSEQEWLLTYPRWVKGMAGSQGPNYWSGKAGLVLSPKMKLGNNAVKVSFKAYNKVAGDNIWVMAVKEHDSSVAEVGNVVPMSTNGNDYTTDTVLLSGVDFGDTPLHIAFMSEQGEFYVDDIKISVIAPTAGTTVEIPYKTINATETSHTLTHLPAGDYAYQVLVKRTKDFLTYTSNYSNRVDVKLLSTDIHNILSEDKKGNKTIKMISNGHLLIIHNSQTYNVLGELIR